MTDTTNEPTQYGLGLPKWPALIVHGDPVTKEQAAEIIIRTDYATASGWGPSCNDKPWNLALRKAMGLPADPYDKSIEWQERERIGREFRDSIGALDLEYLHNERIASSYVGGPSGWCSWGGTVGLRDKNIGKWPSVAEVHYEWKRIAAAFPFLRLRAQLWDREHCEVGGGPVVEFHVHDGVADVLEPVSPLGDPGDDDFERNVLSIFTPGRERGCTIETFRWALDLVRSKVAQS